MNYYIVKEIRSFLKEHLPAILVFLAAGILFYPYVFSSGYYLHTVDLQQNEMANRHLAEQGYNALWNPYIFSGMPNMGAGIEGGHDWLRIFMYYVYNCLSIIQRYDFRFFIIFCVNFYFLTRGALKIDRNVAIVTSVAFALGTANVIYIVAGHVTKVDALSNLPALMAGCIFLLDGFILEGIIIILAFALGSFAHQQITYYSLIVCVVIAIFYSISYYKNKMLLTGAKRIGILLACALIGTASALPYNLMLLDYNKQSLRGGSELRSEKEADDKERTKNENAGLDIEYAFRWSQGKIETFTFLYPGLYGYGNRGAHFEKGSHLAKVFEEKFGQPEEQAIALSEQFSHGAYWGDQPFTEGPVYLGALICLLAIVGAVFSKNKHKYWMIALAIIGIVLAWGNNLMWLNEFLFNHLPLYNKYRVPSMILVIPQVMFPLLAALGLEYIINNKERFTIKSTYLKRLGIVALILLAIGAGLYASLEFKNIDPRFVSAINALPKNNRGELNPAEVSSELSRVKNPTSDLRLYANILQMTRYNASSTKAIFDAIAQDRQKLLWENIKLVFLMFIVFLALVWALSNGTIKPVLFVAFVGIILYADEYKMGREYLNKESYVHSGDDEFSEKNTITPSKADNDILRDPDPNFRVYNLTSENPFSENNTSYFHKSIGGYHPAKLAIYDDLIARQLGKNNPEVIGMLNTKYYIRQNPATGEKMAVYNPNASGNVWFVPYVSFVPDADREMKALDTFSFRKVAVVQEKFKPMIPHPSAPIDPASYIKQTYFSFDTITYAYQTSNPQIAIFSEIYSPYWKAFVDGKEAPIFKADYVLRGMELPVGKHTVEFRCEPEKLPLYRRMRSLFDWLQYAYIPLIAFFLCRKKWKSYKRKQQKTA